MHKWFLVLILTVCSGVAMAQELPEDPELKKLLIGKWRCEQKNGDLTMRTITIYTEDGKMTSTASMIVEKSSTDYSIKGTWDIRDGIIHWEVTASDSFAMTIGEKGRDRIKTLNAAKLIYTDQTGQVVAETRMTEETPQTATPAPAVAE